MSPSRDPQVAAIFMLWNDIEGEMQMVLYHFLAEDLCKQQQGFPFTRDS